MLSSNVGPRRRRLVDHEFSFRLRAAAINDNASSKRMTYDIGNKNLQVDPSTDALTSVSRR